MTIGKIITVLSGSKGLSAALKGIPALIGNIGTAFKSVGNAIWTFVTSPAGVWMLAIGAIIGAVTLIITHWEEIAGFFKGLWEGISNVASAAWEGIKGVLTAAWEGIIAAGEVLWNGFKDFFSDLWEGIKNTAAKAWEGIKGVLGKAWEGIESMAKSIWGGITGTISKAWDFITGKKLPEGLTEESVKQAAEEINTIDWQSDIQGDFTLPEIEGDYGAQSLNDFGNEMSNLGANQILIDIHGNTISDELDIEKIGDQLVHRLYRAGVA